MHAIADIVLDMAKDNTPPTVVDEATLEESGFW